MDRSDQEIIESYFLGNANAFTVLVDRYLPVIYTFLRRYIRDQGILEDVVQETIIKAWKHLKKFDQQKKFKTWILTIARNTALDTLRQKNPRAFSTFDTEDGTFSEDLPGDEISAAELFDQQIFSEMFQKICDQLQDSHRVVLLLHLDEQLTFQEISEVLGEPLNTVKSRYRRALERVRELLPNQYKK